MIIACPSCGKKFDVDDNLIPDKGRLLKCGSCNQTWFFNKNENEEIKPPTNEVVVEEKFNIEEKIIRKPKSNFSSNIQKGSELVKYQPKYKRKIFEYRMRQFTSIRRLSNREQENKIMSFRKSKKE